jgi:hypothetical protein
VPNSHGDLPVTSAEPAWVELKSRIMAGVKHGPAAAGYDGYRQLFFGACKSAIARGYTFNDLWVACRSDPRFAAADSFLGNVIDARGQTEAMRYLLSHWNAAERSVRSHAPFTGRQAVREHLAAQLHEVVTARFPGKGGATRLKLLLVILDAALTQGSVTPAVSRLEFEIWTGLGRNALESGLGALLAAGVLTKQTGEHGHRTRWTVHTAPLVHADEPIGGSFTDGLPDTSNPRLLPSHDVWSARDLSGCWHLYLLLSYADSPVASQSLAETSGLHPKVVRRKLAAMAEHGVALQRGDGEWSRGSTDLDTVAANLGVTGTAALRRDRAEHRAKVRRAWLDQRDEAIRKHQRLRTQWSEWADALSAAAITHTSDGRLSFAYIDNSWGAFCRAIRIDDRSHNPDSDEAEL